MDKITYKCETCGSEDVLCDAWAAWNVERQEWELASVHEYTYCNTCENERRLIDAPVSQS